MLVRVKTEGESRSLRLRSAARVVLTRGPVVVPKWGLSSGLLCPPIGIAYIAATLREHGFPVSIVDPVGESHDEVHPIAGRAAVAYGWSLEQIVAAIPRDTSYVGLACMFSQEWPVSKALARMIRERLPRAVIVAGGEHMTAAAEESLRDCPAIDYAVIGEGEETMLELLETLEHGEDASRVAGLCYLRGGQAVRTAPRARLREVDQIPRPAWDLVPIETYLANNLSYGVGQGRTMPILATRGCPYECTFCSNPTMWTTRWYARSPADVADEIEFYTLRYAATNFDFYDLTAILRKDWIKDFCQELVKRNLKITWQLPAGTRSEAVDEEVAGLLASCGHRNIVYAPESGSERILKIIKKKVRPERMRDSMKAAVRHGISVKLNMIIGFPMETFTDVLRSYHFLVKAAWLGVDDATIATFVPYPGSELFRDLRAQGRIAELSDGFYFGLLAIGGSRHAPSFDEHLSSRALSLCKLVGHALFYGVSYLRRPQRFAQTFWHLYRKDHHTRIEKALDAIFARSTLGRGGVSPGAVRKPPASAPAKHRAHSAAAGRGQ